MKVQNGFDVIVFISTIQPWIRELREVCVIKKMRGFLFLLKQELGDIKRKEQMPDAEQKE